MLHSSTPKQATFLILPLFAYSNIYQLTSQTILERWDHWQPWWKVVALLERDMRSKFWRAFAFPFPKKIRISTRSLLILSGTFLGVQIESRTPEAILLYSISLLTVLKYFPKVPMEKTFSKINLLQPCHLMLKLRTIIANILYSQLFFWRWNSQPLKT